MSKKKLLVLDKNIVEAVGKHRAVSGILNDAKGEMMGMIEKVRGNSTIVMTLEIKNVEGDADEPAKEDPKNRKSKVSAAKNNKSDKSDGTEHDEGDDDQAGSAEHSESDDEADGLTDTALEEPVEDAFKDVDFTEGDSEDEAEK